MMRVIQQHGFLGHSAAGKLAQCSFRLVRHLLWRLCMPFWESRGHFDRGSILPKFLGSQCSSLHCLGKCTNRLGLHDAGRNVMLWLWQGCSKVASAKHNLVAWPSIGHEPVAAGMYHLQGACSSCHGTWVAVLAVWRAVLAAQRLPAVSCVCWLSWILCYLCRKTSRAAILSIITKLLPSRLPFGLSKPSELLEELLTGFADGQLAKFQARVTAKADQHRAESRWWWRRLFEQHPPPTSRESWLSADAVQ